MSLRDRLQHPFVVVDAGDRRRLTEGHVVGEHALTGVCQGQVRHRLRRQRQDLRPVPQHRHDVVMAPLGAFRGPGGSRCVDDGHDVVGLYRAPMCFEVEAVLLRLRHLLQGKRPRLVTVDDDHVLDRTALRQRLPHDREEGRLRDVHPTVRVLDPLPDLRRGGGVVDAERSRAKVVGRGVDHVELGPVGQVSRQRVRRSETQPGETSGYPPHPCAVLRPGQLVARAGDAQGGAITARRDSGLERRTHGGCVQNLLQPVALARIRLTHRSGPP